MLTVIVSGRNDDYGGDFRERLFRTTLHNSARLYAAGIDFEYILAEWNPIPGIPALSEEFVARTPRGRAVIVPGDLHQAYSLNSEMPFHEMAAKNVALRRAKGSLVIVTNADILFSDELVCRLAAGGFASDTLYRAHRIDVDPKLHWDEMQKPENQLPSGEGFLPPPWYLGAGGDFCLAARSLWHSLGGFNERIRFSTRAKDWQFFLSAAARGVGIDFIGDVYHLDHEGGFRNTSASERNSESAHFGRWWDIEFGLPVTNPAGWGFNGIRERQFANHARISILAPDNSAVAEEQNEIDREMIPWLTCPPDSPDTSAAILVHAICAAHREHRRLICRIENPRLLVALSGLEAVASRFGVRICCSWKWPEIAGYTIRPFEPEPAGLHDTDWIVEEHAGSNGGIRIYEYGSAREIHVLPTVVPVTDPEFNPVLARRLLRACLHLQSEGDASTKKIAIYGAGSHTASLLQWGLPDNIEIVETVDSRSLSTLSNRSVAVLLSSSSFESDMLEACRQQGIGNVIALYNDWPMNTWELKTIGVGK